MLPRQTRYAYSPITRRPDYTWPGGKRLAVYLALGIEEYVFGDGLTEDLFPGAPKPDYANTSWRDYGNRVGGFRLIDRFAREGFPVTLLLNTEVYDHARSGRFRPRSRVRNRGARADQFAHFGRTVAAG